MQPASDPRMERHSDNDDNDVEFSQNVLEFAMHFTCLLIIQADTTMRSLDEDGVKETITEWIVSIRHTLDAISSRLPQDESTQREFAQTYLGSSSYEGRHLMFDASESAGDANDDDALPNIEGIVMSPHELRRVGDAFGASGHNYGEQDIVNALDCVRTALADVRNVLLDLDDSDVQELAQMTLISLRILVSYAKSTHRHLAHVFGISPPSRTVGDIHGPGDKGAGRGLSEYHGWFGEPLRADEEEKEAEGSEEKGGLPWQPLTPRLLQEVQRLAMEGKERPLTAAAVVAVALPFSGAAVFIGAPVLAGDAALQWGARTPVGRAAGQTTHNAVELSKLGWVAGKLAAKQTWRLANKELNRMGGATGVVCAVGEGALWTAIHPIEATVASIGLASQAGKAAYGQAVWMGDLLATVGDELFAGRDDPGS